MTDGEINFQDMTASKPKKKGNPNWVKGGASPNPAGRPAVLADLREAARGYSQEALDVLAKVMRDPEAGPAARVTAARELLDRGFGKAVQAVDVSTKVDLGQTAAQVLMELARKGDDAKLIDVTPAHSLSGHVSS